MHPKNFLLFTCCASLCLFAVEMLMVFTSSFHYVERDWLHCSSYTEDNFLKIPVPQAFGTPFFRIQSKPLFSLHEHPCSWKPKQQSDSIVEQLVIDSHARLIGRKSISICSAWGDQCKMILSIMKRLPNLRSTTCRLVLEMIFPVINQILAGCWGQTRLLTQGSLVQAFSTDSENLGHGQSERNVKEDPLMRRTEAEWQVRFGKLVYLLWQCCSQPVHQGFSAPGWLCAACEGEGYLFSFPCHATHDKKRHEKLKGLISF